MSDFNKYKNAVIIGASSGVGRALAQALAAKGVNLVISSREFRDLEALEKDLTLRHSVKILSLPVDMTGEINYPGYLKKCCEFLDNVDVVFIPAGLVAKHDEGLANTGEINSIAKVNYLSTILFIGQFVAYFMEKGEGKVVVFSSIAAAAPRKRNIVYASAKKALETYCTGMQHYLAKTGIDIQVYALGYVDTAMTFGEKLLFPVISPEQVANYVINNLDKNIRFRYYPRFWTAITWILKKLPWFIYKRLSF